MTSITYPSDVVPGPPAIELQMPDGWTQVWAPDTLIAIREETADGDHFLANVVVRFYQRLAPFGRNEIHAELSQYADQRRDGQLGPLKSQTVNGREFVGADLSFVDDAAGAVGQVHWFNGQRSNDVVDVVQVTGSFAGARREQDYATIDRVVDSIRIGV